MSRKNNALPEEQQAKLIEMLNRRLADAIDLQLQSRQAYWNVKGPHFMALRELFDKVAEGVEEYANLIAERIVQLGGRAEGTAHAVAGRSSLDGHGLATCRWERPHRCAFDDAHRLWETCPLRQRAGERTAGRRYGCHLHRDRARHRQMALVRRDEPASRQLSTDGFI